MAKSTNHQCPSCTGPLRFDAKTNLLVCDYCDNKFSVEEIDKLYNEKINESTKKGMDSEESRFQAQATGTTIFKTYTCSSCGAQLFCDEVTVATSCPYCGNPNVIAGKFNGGEMPDVVIPFKMEKKQAVEALKKFYKGKKLLPKVFSAQNHIEEVKGVYVPFWLFSGNADAKVLAEGTRTKVVMTSKEQITTTSHFNVVRRGNIPFEKVPIDASKKMDNSMMDSLEPFNYKDMKDFSASYLPGFFAEVHDDSADNCKKRLEYRMKNTATDVLLDNIKGYENVDCKGSEINLNLTEKPKYAFFPVWLLSTKWKDENYLFAMNGQTGKMVGRLPVDYFKFFRILFGIILIGTCVLTPIIYHFI